jgi:hypothetical protein
MPYVPAGCGERMPSSQALMISAGERFVATHS